MEKKVCLIKLHLSILVIHQEQLRNLLSWTSYILLQVCWNLNLELKYLDVEGNKHRGVVTVLFLDDFHAVCQLALLLIETSLLVHLYLGQGILKLGNIPFCLPVRLGGQAGHPCSRSHC